MTAAPADLAVFWLPDEAAAGADALNERLESIGEGRAVVCSALDAESGVAVLVALEGSDDPDGLTDRVAAEIGDGAPAPVSYRRRYTTDLERAGRYGLTPRMFSVRVFAPPEWQQPIRAWLDEEHFDRQTSALDGVLWSDGYEPVGGEFHFLNLWAIPDTSIIDSPEWVSARETPRWNEVLPGFQAGRVVREAYRVAGA